MKKTLAIISALVASVTISPQSASAEVVSEPIIIAHKTGPLEAPENTAIGITTAKQNNPELQWAEIDVRWNKSDFPFALHDSTLDRTTDGIGNLSNYWLPDLQSMNAADFSPWNQKNANGTWKYPQFHGKTASNLDVLRPSYAYEFIYAAKKANVNLLLDVKETPNQTEATNLYNYITRSEFQYADNVIYMGSVASVSAMNSFYPNLRYFIIDWPAAGMMKDAESIKLTGATGYAIRFDRITKSKVDYYHANDLEVFSWTTDTPAMDVTSNWDRVVNSGVDALITNEHVVASQRY